MPRPPTIPVRRSQPIKKAALQPHSEVVALFKQGLALHQQGQLAQAKQIYEQVLAKHPSHFDALHLSGVIAAQSKNPTLALELIGKAIEINPKSPEAYSNRGAALNALKRLEEAIDSYDKAIAIKPDYAEAYSNRGVTLKELNRFEDAIASYDRAIAIKPDSADAYLKRGSALKELKRVEEALASYDRSIAIKLNNAEAHFNRGVLLQDLKRLEEALDSYDKAIAIKPDYADAYLNRGLVLKKLKRVEEALACYDRTIAIKPDYAEAYSNRGLALQELKLLEEALASYDRAIEIKPDYAGAYLNRGLALQELKSLEEALASYDRAIAIKSDYADAYSNRGAVLQELKRLEEALASFDRAIAIKPDYADVYWNKSLAFLVAGEFAQGWELYEWRWKKDTFTSPKRNFSQPLWLGEEDIAGKTILLHAEQGLGDTLQFCRYAMLVAELGAKVILEVQKPLVNLLQNLAGVSQLVAKGSTLPEFDYQCPLLSLPLAFKTVIQSIPNKIPYIHSRADKEDKWRERIGETGFKIAICWQGSTQGKVDVGRSLPVSSFERLAKIDGVRLISLQKNEGVEQLKNLPIGMKVETLPDDFDSGENAFLDSAAVMKCVDLVITSDTALTHLAGALGVKTWLPVKYVPDWRWMLDRSDSPWYLNHRLFRQATRDDWTSVFKEMETELIPLVSTKATTQQ